VLYAGGLGLRFSGLLLLLPGKARMLNRMYKAVAVLSLLAALANVQVVKMLGTPFNYQWFCYADFLNSTDTFYSSLAGLSVKDILTAVGVGVAVSGAMLVLAALLSRSLLWLPGRTKRYALAALAVAVMAVYLPVAHRYIHKKNFNPHKLANPVTAFLASVVRSVVSAPDLYTRQVPPHLNEFLTADSAREGLPGKLVDAPAPGIRNVVFFVLESVPAKYVGNPEYTPELCKYLPEAGTFSNVYTHCPSTHNSMAALLTSSYPWISYKSITNEYPSIALPSLSGTLKEQHFRTAFMHASDNRFHRMDEFLTHRGFDVQQDFRTLHCGTGVKEFRPAEGEYLNGVDDACLVRSFGHWLGNGDTTKPFFAMLWTMQTHYPYFLSGPEQKMGVSDPYQNRYLNALRHSDAVLGELLAELKRKGLYESALVVVGDHGEAFNDHAQYGHGNAIYEENVHVPLVLINPSLFHGETYATLSGHIDVAPTVLELLGLQPPTGWEGKSLFCRQPPGADVLFCALDGL